MRSQIINWRSEKIDRTVEVDEVLITESSPGTILKYVSYRLKNRRWGVLGSLTSKSMTEQFFKVLEVVDIDRIHRSCGQRL